VNAHRSGGGGAKSLAEELRMMADGDDESCDNNNSRSLLPAHDSCEVDSLPEDQGKVTGLHRLSRNMFNKKPS